MKVVALLFCLLLLLIAIPLVIWNLTGLVLHWSWAIPHAIVAGLVYLLLYLVGRALDRRFALSVERFLSGETDTPASSRGVGRVFGMLLVTLLPYLLYLLLLALYAAFLFVVYVLDALLTMGFAPYVVLAGLAVVLLGSAFGFLSGIFHLLRPHRIGVVGVPVTPYRQPEVWREISEVAAALKTRAVDRVVLTAEAGIGVYQEGSLPRLLFGGGRRVLLLGVPAMHSLTVSELRAVLAHEYGHFAQRDTLWGAFTASMGRSLVAACLATPGPIRLHFPQPGTAAYIMALNPGHWILRAFLYLFHRSTSSFSRQREVGADVLALTHYGRAALCGSLVKIGENARVYQQVISQQLVPMLESGTAVGDYDAAMTYQKTQPADASEGTEDDEPPVATPYDSHPATAQRLAYAERFPDGAGDDAPAEALFRKWSAENARVAVFNSAVTESIRRQTKRGAAGRAVPSTP